MNKPSGVSGDEADAPACATAYLRAVPNCVAGFVYTERGKSTKERWCSCGYRCKSQIPPVNPHNPVNAMCGYSLSPTPLDN